LAATAEKYGLTDITLKSHDVNGDDALFFEFLQETLHLLAKLVMGIIMG